MIKNTINKMGALTGYLLHAKSKFGIHSPFVFELLTNYIHDTFPKEAYNRADNYLNDCCNDHTQIHFSDHGAGGRNGTENTKEIRINTFAKKSSCGKKYGRLLYRLAAFNKADTILELGTGTGCATAYLSTAAPEARIISIEADKELHNYASRKLASLNTAMPELIQSDFQDSLVDIIEDIKQADMVIFDGDHREERLIEYFKACLPLAGNDSIFIIDDINWSKGMQNAWKAISAHRAVTVSIDLFRMGIVFFRRESSKQHFVIRF